jgi:hypothetical protein
MSNISLSMKLLIGILLIAASVFFYFIQVAIFHKPEDTYFYLLQDLAFVPIQVLLVTIIITELFSWREKQAKLGKLNMVIGAFFSEMGTDLLRTLSSYDLNIEEFRKNLSKGIGFSDSDYKKLTDYHKVHEYRIDSNGKDMEFVKSFLIANRPCIMRLLENPNLLEHESFTDLLWAVSHLTEELAYRANVRELKIPDRQHLESDIQRAYSHLTAEWLAYVRHLRKEYPYIFSLVVRINPFEPHASPEIK